MIIDEFLENLREEVGYMFGDPWRYNEKSLGVIVPILKLKTGIIEERNYITIEEAKEEGISFKDSGRIDRVIIESSYDKPIFIRSGTALKSEGTQPRVVESSVVIIPSINKEYIENKTITEQEISVRCIYASKPIRNQEKFTYGGNVPLDVRSELLSRSGQGETWASVGRAASRYATSGIRLNRLRSDDLIGVMEDVDKFQANIDDVIRQIPLFIDQVGAVFLDTNDVVGFEMFDHPTSWEAIHKEVEKRFGESALKEQDSFFKPDFDKVKPLILTFLKKLSDSKKTEMARHETTSTVTINGDGVVGEGTIINGKMMHLVAMKKVKG